METAGHNTELHQADLQRLRTAVNTVRDHNPSGFLTELTSAGADDFLRYCRFTHAAVLLFAADTCSVVSAMKREELTTRDLVPSTVVRARLAHRYGLDENALDAQIAHGALDDTANAREVEVFILKTRPGLEELVEDERRNNHESHLAFHITPSDPVVVAGLCTMLTRDWGLAPDGGGYNPHEDVADGGRTVLYFRSRTGEGPRIELFATGHHEVQLAQHLDTPSEPDAETQRRTMLGYVSGAWTTQALRAMAEFEIADHLADTPLGAAQLAEIIGTHPDATQRLLRYLHQLGALTQDAGRYHLTDLGALLRSDIPGSARELALLYGGLVYQSWYNLPYSLRTGREAFARTFGKPLFDYAADRPATARIFEKAMAFVSEFAESLPQQYDFSTASTVVDVGGGDGAVLSRILSAHPRLRGVLADLPSTKDGARDRLGAAGVADRCTLTSIDMFESVPSEGDVYVLSRILHDWPDAQCVQILANCREAMRPDGVVLVLERLLPDETPSGLTPAWDLQMLVNTSGGTERTLTQYEELFATAGMRLTVTHSLPLDMNIMVVQRA